MSTFGDAIVRPVTASTAAHRGGAANSSASCLVVRQVVADIPVWFANFTASTPARRAAGGGEPVVLVEDERAGRVMVIIPFESAEAATAWRGRLGVRQQIAAAGVRASSVEVRVLRSLSGG
ncbi:hypothetical protein [Frankia sp. R82]|uniref:hypothetical protein n=1 Tax=Frankia sp. R82 TaxID=2950553 RepID=UPI0020443847|nr:hypothetical protein [Frankia sp. R82]MCM3882305.1 hypothetical protein [Frankia sp. R82]